MWKSFSVVRESSVECVNNFLEHLTTMHARYSFMKLIYNLNKLTKSNIKILLLFAYSEIWNKIVVFHPYLPTFRPLFRGFLVQPGP